jgi:hypothetical protein
MTLGQSAMDLNVCHRITDEFILRLDFVVADVKHHGYKWVKKCCYDILVYEIIISPCDSWQRGNASSV